jgi:hypothetical protein
MEMEKYDYYELIDDLGTSYYRWDTNLEMMEMYDPDLGWTQHGWTPASLHRWLDLCPDAVLNVVTADDVR